LGTAPDVNLARRWFDDPRGIAVQWAGIFAGPIAWAFDLQLSYSLVQWTCGGGPVVVLYVIPLGALSMIAAGAYGSWVALQRGSAREREDGSQPDERGRFMAVLGLLMCAFFGLVVIAGAIPRVILDACHS
jgi:hypothetical protein